MSVRPLVMWVARQEATTLRFRRRNGDVAAGVLTGPPGPVAFTYERAARRLHLPERTIYLDEYGWEMDEQGQTVFRSQRTDCNGES